MRTINRHSHLHIGVTRSLRVNVPRDAQVRVRVPSGSPVHLRACMPMPARARLRRVPRAPTTGRGGPEPLRPAARAPRDARGFLVHQEKGGMLTAANMHVAKQSMSISFVYACCKIDMHVA